MKVVEYSRFTFEPFLDLICNIVKLLCTCSKNIVDVGPEHTLKTNIIALKIKKEI